MTRSTEFIIIGSKQRLSKLNECSIRVGSNDVQFPVNTVRNLVGSWFDSNLSMSTHINKLCSTAFFYLHNIQGIRKYFDQKSLLTLLLAFITSRLDYCNSLLYGLPNTEISKLQTVNNAAARTVTFSSKFSHVTPVLCELHWLPVRFRISFKMLLIVFKSLLGQTPLYISNLISVRNRSAYQIWSNDGLLLGFPRGKMLTSFRDWSFSVAAPTLWNALPTSLRK